MATQNKIYYDVNIGYQPEVMEGKVNNYTKAITSIRLNGPLISDPGNYDLAISKFKIDTESLPVFIPEMEQPTDKQFNRLYNPLNGEMKSKYKIVIYYPTYVDGKRQYNVRGANPPNWQDVGNQDFDWEANEYRVVPEAGTDQNPNIIYQRQTRNVTFISNTAFIEKTKHSFNIYDVELPTTTMFANGVSTIYANNIDPAYFQYDYQSVLDRINKCMEDLLWDVSSNNLLYPVNIWSPDECKRAIFFKVEDGKISLYCSQTLIERRIMFKFPSEFYKLIGNGFPIKYFKNPRFDCNNEDEKGDGSFIINYNPFVALHKNVTNDDKDQTKIITDGTYYKDNIDPDNDDFIRNDIGYLATYCDEVKMISIYYETLNVNLNRQYFIYKQQYSTLCNWNACKAVLIYTNTFPVKPEYYPTLRKSPFLTHYKEDWYQQEIAKYSTFLDLNDEEHAIFDKSTLKILDVYYPISSQAGDIKSSVIYTNENIESGNKIDMIGGMDIENFDIGVKWVDIYGNVYDLYLAPGSSVNIRMCFTRKKILRDELQYAFDQINGHLEAIAKTQVPEPDANKTFDIKKEPKRKRNKVELPGVLENGLIIKP